MSNAAEHLKSFTPSVQQALEKRITERILQEKPHMSREEAVIEAKLIKDRLMHQRVVSGRQFDSIAARNNLAYLRK